MKITMRVYEKNPSVSRTLKVNEDEFILAISAYFVSTGQIDTRISTEVEIDEVTI
jgi:redox-regulated HSP33 family molecular chaperone